jgi:hypothetical protein
MISFVHVYIDPGGGHFEFFVFNCDLLDNKNSTVITLGMCVMSVSVKCYTFKVFLSITTKTMLISGHMHVCMNFVLSD